MVVPTSSIVGDSLKRERGSFGQKGGVALGDRKPMLAKYLFEAMSRGHAPVESGTPCTRVYRRL